MRLVPMAIPVAVLAACGSGGGSGGAPDLSGMYLIDHHTESLASGSALATCSGEGAAVTSPAYLRVYLDSFGGQSELRFAFCTTTDVASCDDQFLSFQDVGGAWDVGAASSASYSGGICSFYHAEGTATRSGTAGVRIETKEWDEADTVAQSQCVLDTAEALGSKSGCDTHLVVTGTPAP